MLLACCMRGQAYSSQSSTLHRDPRRIARVRLLSTARRDERRRAGRGRVSSRGRGPAPKVTDGDWGEDCPGFFHGTTTRKALVVAQLKTKQSDGFFAFFFPFFRSFPPPFSDSDGFHPGLGEGNGKAAHKEASVSVALPKVGGAWSGGDVRDWHCYPTGLRFPFLRIGWMLDAYRCSVGESHTIMAGRNARTGRCQTRQLWFRVRCPW
jgi:hypothetical protein